MHPQFSAIIASSRTDELMRSAVRARRSRQTAQALLANARRQLGQPARTGR